MVFIIGKALVNLRSGQLREAVCRQCIDRFAILKQANDVVDGDPGTFHYRVPAPHARRTDDVAIGLRDRVHTWMVRRRPQGVNGRRAREQEGLNVVSSVFEIRSLWAPSLDAT